MKPFGFSYDPDEMEAVLDVFDSRYLSLERIYDEFNKMFQNRTKDIEFLLEHLEKLHIFKSYIPDPNKENQILKKIISCSNLLPLSWSYMEGRSVVDTVRILKLSKKERKLLEMLKYNQGKDFTNPRNLKELLCKYGFFEINEIAKAFSDILGVEIAADLKKINEEDEFICLNDLSVSGNDLIDMGIKGKFIGLTLNYLLSEVWGEINLNTRPVLLKLAEDFAKGKNYI